MRRTFVEFIGVTRVLRSQGVTDEALRRVQRLIMEGEGDLIKGTGGLRKIRCAAEGRGKSGGVRLVFADYAEMGVCLFVAAFAKNVKENLSKAEQAELGMLKASLDRRMREIKERRR